ncbi:unnamed protein product [Amoebophrya sp. A25]|nr:unnamed protein product [Amoebophrya sp. A25]|eukprot:GSA25T00001026001.1
MSSTMLTTATRTNSGKHFEQAHYFSRPPPLEGFFDVACLRLKNKILLYLDEAEELEREYQRSMEFMNYMFSTSTTCTRRERTRSGPRASTEHSGLGFDVFGFCSADTTTNWHLRSEEQKKYSGHGVLTTTPASAFTCSTTQPPATRAGAAIARAGRSRVVDSQSSFRQGTACESTDTRQRMAMEEEGCRTNARGTPSVSPTHGIPRGGSAPERYKIYSDSETVSDAVSRNSSVQQQWINLPYRGHGEDARTPSSSSTSALHRLPVDLDDLPCHKNAASRSTTGRQQVAHQVRQGEKHKAGTDTQFSDRVRQELIGEANVSRLLQEIDIVREDLHLQRAAISSSFFNEKGDSMQQSMLTNNVVFAQMDVEQGFDDRNRLHVDLCQKQDSSLSEQDVEQDAFPAYRQVQPHVHVEDGNAFLRDDASPDGATAMLYG